MSHVVRTLEDAVMKTSIATVSVGGTLDTKLEAIAKAGFAAVEIFENDLLSSPLPARQIGSMMQDLGLYNTYWALIILYTAFRIPFTTFLIRAYMLGLPRDLDEAAIMDGASEGQIFWRVILPLCKPVIVSCVILHVLFAWNEYLFAMIFTSGADLQTLPVGLTSIMAKHGTNYAVVFAAMTLSALPIVISFFAAQRFFIRGLAEGIGK